MMAALAAVDRMEMTALGEANAVQLDSKMPSILKRTKMTATRQRTLRIALRISLH